MPNNKIIDIPPIAPPSGGITAEAAQDWCDLGEPLPVPAAPEKPAATLPAFALAYFLPCGCRRAGPGRCNVCRPSFKVSGGDIQNATHGRRCTVCGAVGYSLMRYNHREGLIEARCRKGHQQTIPMPHLQDDLHATTP